MSIGAPRENRAGCQALRSSSCKQGRCSCPPNFKCDPSAKQATKTIPIVMVTQVDPVAAGLVDSLAPGGNVTGLATRQRDLSGKRLELLTEVVPRLSREGVLRNLDAQIAAIGFKDYEAAACVKDKALIPGRARSQSRFGGAFREASRGAQTQLSQLRITRFFIIRRGLQI